MTKDKTPKTETVFEDPTYLDPIAYDHYTRLVARLKKEKRYKPLDSAILEFMAHAYSAARDPEAKDRDRREYARLYAKFAQWFGMSDHARRMERNKKAAETIQDKMTEEELLAYLADQGEMQ